MSRKARGFTLVEVLTVVAIIAVISALAVPNMLGLIRATRVRGQGSTLAAALNATRAQAMTSGLVTVVCLRGPAYAGTPGDETTLVNSYRKANPVPTIDATTASQAPGDKALDRQLMDPLTRFQFPAAIGATKTVQLVYDVSGALTVFTGDDCTPASDATRSVFAVPAAGVTFTTLASADAAITQDLVLRSDGSMVVP